MRVCAREWLQELVSLLNSENVPMAMVAIASAYSALPDPSRPQVVLTDHDMLAEVETTTGLLTGKSLSAMKPMPLAQPTSAGAAHVHMGVPGQQPTLESVQEAIVAKAIAMLRTGAGPRRPAPFRAPALPCPSPLHCRALH